ncbi:hypothetical protein SAMN04515620_11770 [Collimonas sp. OK607]|nr:hypothetical protein SAMN04515620_11770 [Collimonas sp. OK607]
MGVGYSQPFIVVSAADFYPSPFLSSIRAATSVLLVAQYLGFIPFCLPFQVGVAYFHCINRIKSFLFCKITGAISPFALIFNRTIVLNFSI